LLFNFSFDQLPGTLDMFSGCCLPVGISIRFKIICLCEKKKPIVTNDICYLYFYLLLFVDDHFDKYSSSIIELVGTNVTLYFLIS
jgi:hypothetical protein